ncbi:hypothetical protein [Francisella sp. SYW-9]|uniref:hypothetical protein n=1 Tax=Francisella sp. SYW-9 TaxID=2610888 RepID=UPI00123D5894|nr:hypothetical protein [Francisella sp. SYW-9]
MEEKIISFKELETKWGVSRNTLYRYVRDLRIERIEKNMIGTKFRYSITESQVKELEIHKNKIESSIGRRKQKDLDIDSYLKTSFGDFNSKAFYFKNK